MKFRYLWIPAVVCILPFAALAAEFRVGEQPSVPSTEKIAKDTYIAGGNVSSAGAITGDLVAIGGNILITGSVSQDLIAGGGSISILGSVGDDLRVGGGNIVINGSVRGDLVAGGGQVSITGEGVGGDVVWGGGVLRIEAPVAGDVRIGGGEVFISAPIGGSVYYKGDVLALGEHAVIKGDLSYTASREAKIAEGARIEGDTNFTPRETAAPEASAIIAAVLTLAFLAKFLMTLACALVFGLVFRRFALAIVEHATEQPLLEFGRGFAVLVLVPVASVMLLVTILGIPLGVLGLLSFIALIIFASVAAPILLGSLIHKWFTKSNEYDISWKSILTGSVVYTILILIPLLGWIAKCVLFLMVIGASVKIKWNIAKEWR